MNRGRMRRNAYRPLPIYDPAGDLRTGTQRQYILPDRHTLAAFGRQTRLIQATKTAFC